MDKIDKIFNKVFVRKEFFGSALLEIEKIFCKEINSRYLILTPTPKNLEFMKSFKSACPESNVFFDPPNVGNCKRLTMMDILLASLQKNKNEQSIFFTNYLKENYIIVKKDCHLDDFMNAIELTDKLSESRSFFLKTITLWDLRVNNFFLINLEKLYEEKIKRDKFFNVTRFDLKEFSIDVGLQFNLSTDINEILEMNRSEISSLKSYYKDIVKQTTQQSDFPFKGKTTLIGDGMTIFPSHELGKNENLFLQSFDFVVTPTRKKYEKNAMGIYTTIYDVPITDFRKIMLG